MDRKQLEDILDKHRKWLCGEDGGERANLRGADLQGANLWDADLRGANLQGANLRGANLRDADLRGANLRGANLRGDNLRGADLRGANLWGADLRGADLQGANLRYTDLRGADLQDANLRGVVSDERTAFFAIQCPEKGSFTAFKKAGKCVVELAVPEDAKRSSATSRKCRCNKATVVKIWNTDGTLADITEIASNYDDDFVYKVGESVEVSDFNEDRWNECSAGIHFFITFDEAKNY